MVLANLPAAAERNGMDYSNAEAVQKQKENILRIVRETKNHPAILMWAIGNEMDYIPGNKPFNPALWDAVNDIAKEIKKIDPDHPVTTVIGTSLMEKVADIARRCPQLDALAVNTYGDIYTLPQTLKKYGWNKPYLIAEWGPDGYWEVRKSPWKAPYEQTAREKYESYKKKYEQAILANRQSCLGSYVFYWGCKQETTHTWFCMFSQNGYETPLVKLMQQQWTGKRTGNTAPIVDSLNINGLSKYQAPYLVPGSQNKARVWLTEKDRDTLTLYWEIRPEAIYASYAGQGEKEPQPIEGLIQKHDHNTTFTAPKEKGAYRLFVYAFDGKRNVSSANLPFYVQE
jgi:hypothetical protein